MANPSITTKRADLTMPQLSGFNVSVYRARCHVPQSVFYAIGAAFLAYGFSVMSYSKKLQSATWGAPFIWAGGLFITLVGMAAVYAGNQIANGERWIQAIQNRIHKYEQSGHYATALQLAQNTFKKLKENGLEQDAQQLLPKIEHLELQLLTCGFSKLLFDENFTPKATLLKLLESLGMEPLNESESAIDQINRFGQTHLLRRGERWEAQTQHFEALKPTIKPLLNELGFIQASSAHFKQYEGAIVHGGLLPRARLRLHYLVEQWKQGVTFSSLYFLTGSRPLEPQHENQDAFKNDENSLLKIRKDWRHPATWPITECEMIQLIWEQSDIPQQMREQINIVFIDVPMKQHPTNEKLIRPTTDDTVIAWLQSHPSLGRYLAITNAPYTNRQDLVVRSIAKSPDYLFDTIGSGADDQEQMAIFLDELARYIFQIKQLSKK